MKKCIEGTKEARLKPASININISKLSEHIIIVAVGDNIPTEELTKRVTEELVKVINSAKAII